MLIIDENLEQLCAQYSICDKDLVDHYSVRLKLGDEFFEPQPIETPIIYGLSPEPNTFFSEKKVFGQNLSLLPNKQVIACTLDQYVMPSGYFGLVQTKGTLARMFVMVTCNDGQVEPGFEGHITLEIVNLSPWEIKIPRGSEVAQMYIIKCSTTATHLYSGRYSEIAKQGATIPVFNRKYNQ